MVETYEGPRIVSMYLPKGLMGITGKSVGNVNREGVEKEFARIPRQMLVATRSMFVDRGNEVNCNDVKNGVGLVRYTRLETGRFGELYLGAQCRGRLIPIKRFRWSCYSCPC